MAEMGSHETELTKTISGAERDRRVAAVKYARASVVWRDSRSVQQMKNMLNGSSTGTLTSKNLCNRVVPWRAQKLSHDEENIGG